MAEVPLPPQDYFVGELPSINICRHLSASGWALPVVQVNQDRSVFASPEQARDSNAETATGHAIEFRNPDDTVYAFARSTDYSDWFLSSIAFVERVDGGWVLDRWERATC